MQTELVLGALKLANWQRHPTAGVIHHSDHGCQYTALRFGARCQEAAIRCSMGSADDCYDNAMVESFFATLECELLAQQPFRTRSDARPAADAVAQSALHGGDAGQARRGAGGELAGSGRGRADGGSRPTTYRARAPPACRPA